MTVWVTVSILHYDIMISYDYTKIDIDEESHSYTLNMDIHGYRYRDIHYTSYSIHWDDIHWYRVSISITEYDTWWYNDIDIEYTVIDHDITLD